AAHARGQGKSDEAKELNEHARKAEQESEDATETERSDVDAMSDIPSVADEHARDDNARQEPRQHVDDGSEEAESESQGHNVE
ncbi:MAG: hypothetical protein ABW217_11935, partial [Polyangiaceae bacterium]